MSITVLDPNGGWALGCRIDGGQAEYVRVPYADQGLNVIPDGVSDREALFVGDVLATGFWAARIAEIKPEDTVLILGAGPTGICTLLCARLRGPGRVIVCEPDPVRRRFVEERYGGGADRNAGAGARFCPAIQPAWRRGRGARGGGNRRQLPACLGMRAPQRGGDRGCAVRRAADAAVADMYGKNLTFKTGGVDGCDCAEILRLIAAGRLDTTPLITHIPRCARSTRPMTCLSTGATMWSRSRSRPRDKYGNDRKAAQKSGLSLLLQASQSTSLSSSLTCSVLAGGLVIGLLGVEVDRRLGLLDGLHGTCARHAAARDRPCPPAGSRCICPALASMQHLSALLQALGAGHP